LLILVPFPFSLSNKNPNIYIKERFNSRGKNWGLVGTRRCYISGLYMRKKLVDLKSFGGCKRAKFNGKRTLNFKLKL
jgi:hypothetical protein